MLGRVVFRRWKDSGEVVAVFPEIPADAEGRQCVTYQCSVEYGAAEYFTLMRATTPAEPEEHADLAHELASLGYHVEPIWRARLQHHRRRLHAARATAPAETCKQRPSPVVRKGR